MMEKGDSWRSHLVGTHKILAIGWGCGQNPLIIYGASQSPDPPKPPLKRGALKPPLLGRGGLGGILSNYF